MALVDYSSDSDPDPANHSSVAPAGAKAEETRDVTAAPSAKRRKVSQTKASGTASPLPPLPSAFHDLYASTVRVSTNDDPTLHQGRKRVNPHRAGNWPTHLYIEWHPTSAERALLASLLDEIRASAPASTEIVSFLHSDLGAPQPLHISLSRPIVLGTPQKDGFVEELAASVGRSGIQPFDLAPRALAWHRTAESARSFLVLRVASSSSSSNKHSRASATTTTTIVKNARAAAAAAGSSNPELAELLGRCNALVAKYGQPPLYAAKALEGGGGGSSSSSTAPDGAFHVSVAWSLAEVDADLRERTEVVAAEAEESRGGGVSGMRVRVDGVKAKIGNVVTHVALPARGRSANTQI